MHGLIQYCNPEVEISGKNEPDDIRCQEIGSYPIDFGEDYSGHYDSDKKGYEPYKGKPIFFRDEEDQWPEKIKN